MKKALDKISSPGEPLIKTIFKLGYFLVTAPGIAFIRRKMRRALLQAGITREHDLTYEQWVIEETASPAIMEKYKKGTSALREKGGFAIALITDECDDQSIAVSISSITAQVYATDELRVVTPKRYHAQVAKAVREATAKSTEVSIIAYEAGDEIAIPLKDTTSHIVIMREGVQLAPGYLYEIAQYIEQTDADIVYTDSDLYDAAGHYQQPYFRPGWSPDTLLSKNYIGHTFAAGKALFEACGGINEHGIYDLLLRAAEQAKLPGRIPRVLYHDKTEQHITQNDKATLERTLQRRGTPGSVTQVMNGLYTADYTIYPEKVSIIIPTRDNAALLKTTLDSIIALTSYKNYEIVLLDNNSTSTEFRNLVADYSVRYASFFRCIPAPFPFNFSKLMNMGVAESTGELVLLLNNDMEILHGNWLEKMMGYAQQPHIGAVGARLLYPDNTVQHAGVVLGVGEGASHAFINEAGNSNIYFNAINTTADFSAVTAACLMVRKTVYLEAGGMDETLPVEFNDIDFCLKLRQLGYYNVYMSQVTLYHYESATRGHPFKSIDSWKQHERDLSIFNERWQAVIADDPFYNPNLSAEYTDFRQKKRVKK